MASVETKLEATAQKEQTASREYDLARAWAAYDAAIADYIHELTRFGERVEGLIGIAISDVADLGRILESARAAATASVTAARELQAAAHAKREAIPRFVHELSEAEAVCPVCLRSIEPNEAEHAIASHNEELERLAREVTQRTSEKKEAERKLELVESLRTDLSDKQRPLKPTDQRSTALDEAKEALANLRSQRDRLRDDRSSLLQQQKNIRERLAQDDEKVRRLRRAERAYRKESLAAVAQSTLNAVAAEVNERRREPLSREWENRWKEFWGGDGGLHVLPSGQLTLLKRGRRIAYEQMSGGEKVIAVLMVRLITVFMTTRSRFLWLDEPLEHLDPRNRRMVASLLVKATGSGQFDQLLVTTYEEPVARRLADQTERANVVYVTSDPVT